MRPQGRREVVALLERYGLVPDQRLGQHYLVDPNLVKRIVRLAAVGPGDQVLEVGPGTGTLTAALASSGASVLAIEVDRRLEPLLTEVLQGATTVRLLFSDAMEADWDALLVGGRWHMVSNLPYNIGTPLLLDLLREIDQITRFVVMVQKEVADRLAAAPGSSQYGLPSVTAALKADVKVEFSVPPQVFVPPPKVGSAVVSLRRREVVGPVDRAIGLAARAFGQRRKMLRRSLAGTVSDSQLRTAGIDPTRRPEELAPLDFVHLAEVVDG